MLHISDLINSSITNKELNDHSSKVIKIVQSKNIEDAKLIGFTERLSVDNITLKIALNHERKSVFTSLLRSLDGTRDHWFRSLVGHVHADLIRPVVDISKAAKRIYQIIRNHGLQLNAGSYEEESAQLESLFVDLDKAPQQEDLDKLGMVDVYEGLKQAQNDFNETYVERINSVSEKERIIAASYIQKTVKHDLELVTQYIDVMVSAEEAPFEKLALAIDELTEKMNQKIRTRSTAEAKKKKKRQS